MTDELQAVLDIRDAAAKLYTKHREFWQAIAFDGVGELSPVAIGLLAVTHNEAVAEMQRTIRVAERVLTEAGVDVTPADFSPAVVVAENVTR